MKQGPGPRQSGTKGNTLESIEYIKREADGTNLGFLFIDNTGLPHKTPEEAEAANLKIADEKMIPLSEIKKKYAIDRSK